jgi:hypothetical protein
MEETCSSETSIDFQRTTRRYISEDKFPHNQPCEHFKSYTWKKELGNHVNGPMYWYAIFFIFERVFFCIFFALYTDLGDLGLKMSVRSSNIVIEVSHGFAQSLLGRYGNSTSS